MKSQKKPFIVEIKRKRGIRKPPRSIWAGIDLAAMSEDAPGDNTHEPAEKLPEPANAIVQSELPAEVGPSDPPRGTRSGEQNTAQTPDGQKRSKNKIRYVRARRRRADKDKPLRREHRWKRRLPKVLREQ